MSESVAVGLGLGAGAAGYLALASFVWLHRRSTGARALVVLLLAVLAWSVCYAFELSSHTLATARIWSGLKFTGIVVLVPAFWAFVTAYSGRRPMRARTLALLSIEPVVVLVVLTVPSLTHLLHTYPAAEIAAAQRSDRAPLPDAGVLFWPHAAYTYVLMLGAVAVLAIRLTRVTRSYRRQAVALIASTVTPFLGNLAFNLNTSITGEVDPTPFLFLITAVVLVWGFFRLRLLDLVPVARGVVIEQMADGVLVLDPYGRVVDANPAGAAMLGVDRSEVVGRYAVDLLQPVAALLDRHGPERTTRSDSTFTVTGAHGAMDVAASITSLADPGGRETGGLLMLTDVTAQVATQRRLRELLDEQTKLAEILQTGLRPPELPEVPGLRMSARSLPGGRGGGVGGDFYDVHPATGGEWAFVLGDVSGKGVRAAVVTSMARYAVRTLSAQGWPPAELLDQLNRVLLEPRDPERFCTVVYGRLAAAPGGSGAGGVRVTLALGGHPAPILRRRDGTVSTLQLEGTALGLLPSVQFGQTVVDLGPGDLLVAYTDGVTEARRDGEQFGELRLATVLSAAADLARDSGGADQAGTPDPAALVDSVADAVVAAVVEYSCDRDDVAVLVLAAR